MPNKNYFNEDLATLVRYIQDVDEADSNFFMLNVDFLTAAFSALVGSDWFIQLDKSRREELFQSYQSLSFTLNHLSEFCSKYPNPSLTTVSGNYKEKEKPTASIKKVISK